MALSRRNGAAALTSLACAALLAPATQAVAKRPPATTVRIAIPPAGHLGLARVLVPVGGPTAYTPPVTGGPAPAGVTVMGGAVRTRDGAAVVATVLVAVRAGSTAAGTVPVRIRVARRRAPVVRETALDVGALATGKRGDGARIGRLTRGTPVTLLAGPPLPGIGPQRLARRAFFLLYRPLGETQRKVATEIGGALGLPPPPPPPKKVRPFKIQVAPYAPPVAPVACPSRPPLVALQDADAMDRLILNGTTGLPGLVARQIPHMALGGVAPAARPHVVWGYDLVTMTSAQMARTLRAAVDAAPNHLVVVDRIEGAEWSDGPAAEPPVVDPASKGVALRAAMADLDVPSRWGGTYARHIHFWIGPGLHSAIGAGLGPNHNLGRDGKPHRRTYIQAMRALSGAAGVWNQMFHGPAPGLPADPLSVEEWMRWPTAFSDFFTVHGGSVERIHFIFMETSAMPSGPLPAGVADLMDAQFALAAQPGVNSRILCNGPGGLNVVTQGRAWLAAYDRYLPAGRPAA